MGTGFSSARRELPKLKNYNVVNRAEKLLTNNEKLRVPPKHKSYAEALKHFQKQNPELFQSFGEQTLEKNEKLSRNLKSVFVTSEGDNPQFEHQKSSSVEEEKVQAGSTKVPSGKLSVSMLLELLQKLK